MRRDRKFECYHIYVIDPRGNKNRIEYPEEEEKDYFKMLKNYNKCKEEFTYEKQIIFAGLNKETNEYKEINIYENTTFDLNAPYKTLIGQMFMIVEELVKRKKKESKTYSELDIEDQKYCHIIEDYEGVEEKTDEEKIKIYNDYSAFRKKRRHFKNEMYQLNVLLKSVDLYELYHHLKNHINIVREKDGELETLSKKDINVIDSEEYNYIIYDPNKPSEKKKLIKKMKSKYSIKDDVDNHRLILNKKKK